MFGANVQTAFVFINPKIIKKSGACNSYEGCLSFPEAYTNVRRYENVMVKADVKVDFDPATGANGAWFVMDDVNFLMTN